VLDLGSVVAGGQTLRIGDTQRTMAMCLGLGMDDVAVARLVYQRAMQMQIGTMLDM
jgi:ornithine cyclodeaminase/alanine dehydrogenase-like protein (mu-crystallin family)